MNVKATIFIAAILCVGFALCQTAPKLPQQFTTNYTVVFPDFPSTVYISGFLAIDLLHGGAFLDIGGEEFVPLSFHTNLVASPDNQGIINVYMYEGPLCWNTGQMPLWMIGAFPLQIPQNSTYLGNKVISGQSCTGWSFLADAYGIRAAATVWVSISNGNPIVQLQIDDVEYVNTVVINFSNTAVGPFSPYVYAPPMKTNPNINCTRAAWNNNPMMNVLFRK